MLPWQALSTYRTFWGRGQPFANDDQLVSLARLLVTQTILCNRSLNSTFLQQKPLTDYLHNLEAAPAAEQDEAREVSTHCQKYLSIQWL